MRTCVKKSVDMITVVIPADNEKGFIEKNPSKLNQWYNDTR
jgi:hypothetical protein